MPANRLLRRLVPVALMACAVGVSTAFAQDTAQGRLSGLKLDNKQPIQIESDKLEVRESENLAIFIGNVNVVQGDTLLKSGRMKVFYAKQGEGSAATGSANIERLEVDGKVYVKSGKQVATGERGIFDMRTEILTLSGDEVVLSEDNNVLVGCKLVVDMGSGEAQVEGCADGGKAGSGRVMMSITPGAQNRTQ